VKLPAPKGMESPLDPLFYSDGGDATESAWERVRAASAERPCSLGRANALVARSLLAPDASLEGASAAAVALRATGWVAWVDRCLAVPAGRGQPAEPAAPALRGGGAPGAAPVDRGGAECCQQLEAQAEAQLPLQPACLDCTHLWVLMCSFHITVNQYKMKSVCLCHFLHPKQGYYSS
jgi:hypothetical protein